MEHNKYLLAKDWRLLGEKGVGQLFSMVPMHSWAYPNMNHKTMALPDIVLSKQRQDELNQFLTTKGFDPIPFDQPWYKDWLELKRVRSHDETDAVRALVNGTALSHEAQQGLLLAYDEHLLEVEAGLSAHEREDHTLEKWHQQNGVKVMQAFLNDPVKIAWLEYHYGVMRDLDFTPDKTQQHYRTLAETNAADMHPNEQGDPVVREMLKAHRTWYPKAAAFFKERYGVEFSEPNYYFINDAHEPYTMKAFSKVPMIVVNLARLHVQDLPYLLPHEFSHLAHQDMYTPKHHADLVEFTMESELRCDRDAAYIQGSVLPRVTDLLKHEVKLKTLPTMPQPVTPEHVQEAIDILKQRYALANRVSPGYPFAYERLQDLLSIWQEVEALKSVASTVQQGAAHEGKVVPITKEQDQTRSVG